MSRFLFLGDFDIQSEMREVDAVGTVTVAIDNFKVNSAQQITESDI